MKEKAAREYVEDVWKQSKPTQTIRTPCLFSFVLVVESLDVKQE